MNESGSLRSSTYLSLFALAITIPLLLIFGALLFQSASAQRAQLEDRVFEALDGLANDIDRDFDSHITILNTLATSRALTNADWPAFYDQAKAALQGRAYLILVDANGRQVLNTYVPYGQQPAMTGDPETVRRIAQTKAPVVSNLFVSLVVKKPVFNVSIPILQDGQVRYVMSLGLLPEDLLALLRSQELGSDWVTLIWDANGVILARSVENARYVGTQLPQRLREQDQRAVVRTTNLDSADVWHATARSQVSGWGVGVNIPYSLVTQQMRDSLLLWGVAAVLAIATALALGLLFARPITTSLEVAAKAADAFGRGEPFPLTSSRLKEADGFLVALRNARAELEQASRLKDEFLAVLSHELRTPLNAVLGYTHLLSAGALAPDRAAHALRAIQRNAQSQARLVEALLDLSRIMAGKLELDLQHVDVSRIVDAAVDVIRPEAEAKGVSVEVIGPKHQAALLGDPGRLQQVLWNLLSNAVKFTPPEGRVTIRSEDQDGHVRIEVSDTGQGIGAEFLPHVFDRFSQADGQKRRSQAGLGLGLALVREMVHAHKGTVVAESAGEGRGSTFIVTLPAATGMTTVDSREPTAPEATTQSLPPLEVLIVDDDGDVRDLLVLLLESRGATAHAVSSAAEALDAIRVRRPHVLLADLRMPDEDGLSLIRRLRGYEREAGQERLPAIAVTAYASPSDREQAIAAGYDSHVAKPVDPEDLARAVAIVVKAESA